MPASMPNGDSPKAGTNEKRLFTPGPLNTRLEVRQAMLKDLGSRDELFMETVRFIRCGLLQLAGVSEDTFTVVPVQGSGTYCVEAVIQTTAPRLGAKVLVLCNGAYGRRIVSICETAGIPHHAVHQPEYKAFSTEVAEEAMMNHGPFTAVAVVHCETSSGVLNPVDSIGDAVRRLQPSATYIVDSMSAFGAVPIDIDGAHVDYLVSSANKCIEGVPGFGFAICRLDKLKQTKGNSRSLSLDLYEQWANLEKTGQFRFTPPTHTMLAFRAALQHLLSKGGVPAQQARYKTNNAIVKQALSKLGFRQLVNDGDDCFVITSFLCPNDVKFNFKEFYSKLAEMGQVIYPGKVTDADCFRVGNIGDLHPEDMHKLASCVEIVLGEMGVNTPVSYD